MRLFWMFLLVIGKVNCDPFEKELIDNLLQNYSHLERPVRHHNDAVVVYVKFSLQQIVDVDERNQIISSNAWLDLKWTDYRLKWDRSKYGNLSKTRIPYQYIWTPDILLYNNADNNFDSTTHTSIVIGDKGDCLYIPPGLFKSTCKIDVSNFPFDEQVCTLKFGVWSYNGDQVDLQLQPGGGTDSTEYIESGEWKLINVVGKRNIHKYKCCPDQFVDVTFSVALRRRTMFYIINLILPCVLNSVLTLLTFVLPAEAAEKVTLAITVLLAQIVFMLLIMETMPPTSDAIPLISKYFACSLVTVCASVGGTVLVLSFYYKSPEIDGRMSPLLRKLLLVSIPKLMHMEPFVASRAKHFYTNHSVASQKLAGKSPRCNGKVPRLEAGNTNNNNCDAILRSNNNRKGLFESIQEQSAPKQQKYKGLKRMKRERSSNQLALLQHQQTVQKRLKNFSFTRDDVKSETESHVKPAMHNRSQSRDSYFDIAAPDAYQGKDLDSSTASSEIRTRNSAKSTGKKSLSCASSLESARALQEILRRLQRINRKVEQESDNNEILLEWQYAARVLDKLLLWIFSLFVVIATLATLFAVPNINDVFTM